MVSEGFLKNCLLDGRNSEVLFEEDLRGELVPTMDGYAILPLEKYQKLLQLAYALTGDTRYENTLLGVDKIIKDVGKS